MFDIGFWELLVIGVVALLVIAAAESRAYRGPVGGARAPFRGLGKGRH
jgi:Sec-independent protein translocase protein TatA